MVQSRAMLKIEDITYNVEGRPLFEGASATIPPATRSALSAATAPARPRSSA
jgi:ATP-binding cassette subfamily F protein 3